MQQPPPVSTAVDGALAELDGGNHLRLLNCRHGPGNITHGYVLGDMDTSILLSTWTTYANQRRHGHHHSRSTCASPLSWSPLTPTFTQPSAYPKKNVISIQAI
ncbi:hypothetical protein Bca101_050224 [Brassica carinata]